MVQSMEVFLKTLRKARDVSTPLVVIRTADPAKTIRSFVTDIVPKDECPLVRWDASRGLAGLNEKGQKQARGITTPMEPAMVTRPNEALGYLTALAEESIVFFFNAHRFYNDDVVVQAVWNLRDSFKKDGRMLVMLTTPGAILPTELSSDTFVLDEPLPSPEDLREVVQQGHKDAKLPVPIGRDENRAVDALTGLPSFPAEQALLMSLRTKGLDFSGLWARKRQAIEQTRGLSVWQGGETFDDIGGVENVKSFLQAVLNGVNPPRVVVWIDEIEKMFSGFGTDSSGVKTELVGTVLSWMQNIGARGAIFVGPGGTAKSIVAKATGNTAGVPTIAFDLAAMQDSKVGESGDRLRTALKIVEAVSQGNALFLATCNRITSLPSELRRRFSLGTFFFDLPTPGERDLIWNIHRTKFQIPSDATQPDDMDWTGWEIHECCRNTYELKMTLQQAAAYIVPVATSAPEDVQALRMLANGKFLSASRAGVYRFGSTADDASASTASGGPGRRNVRVIGE